MSQVDPDAGQALAFPLLRPEMESAPAIGESGCEAERVARLEAERLAQARGDVLAIVAHDLRNPLNVIDNVVQFLLAESPSPEQQSRLLRITERAATHMKRLTGDLLEAIRVEWGNLALDIIDVEVREILHDVEETFRHAAADRRIQLTVHPPGRPCFVRADGGRVQQAAGNLLANALKFTEAGGRIVLSAELSDGEIVFRVADTGPGIDPVDQPYLFDRFWQARNGDRRGAGLGLAIAKGIIDAHGGRIWVESAVGVGTTFSFTLPRSGTRPQRECASSRLPD
jgi:signal transduction histidine kinase